MDRWSRLRAVLVFVVAFAAASGGLAAQPKPVAAAACGIPTCTLTIHMLGNGSGTWKTTNSGGTPNGYIDCQITNGVQNPGSVCSHVYGGEDRATPLVIYYAATPATGSKVCSPFSGVCTNAAQTGQITLDSNRELSPTYTLLTYTVGVVGTGSGMGTITSSPAGIVCPGYGCSANFNYGTALALTAVPANGSYFEGWLLACAGQGATCHLTVEGATNASAIFQLGSPPTATPAAPTPTATATVVATPKVTKAPGPTASAVPPSTALVSSAPVASSAAGTLEPAASPAATTPETAAATSPGEPPTALASPAAGNASASSADLTPIALAVLGAGLLIAIGIGFAGFMIVRRRRSSS